MQARKLIEPNKLRVLAEIVNQRGWLFVSKRSPNIAVVRIVAGLHARQNRVPHEPRNSDIVGALFNALSGSCDCRLVEKNFTGWG